jgi:protein SCO1/2
MAYTIDHSSVIYVIDKQGNVQTHVQHASAPAELAEAIRQQLGNSQ